MMDELKSLNNFRNPIDEQEWETSQKIEEWRNTHQYDPRKHPLSYWFCRFAFKKQEGKYPESYQWFKNQSIKLYFYKYCQKITQQNLIKYDFERIFPIEKAEYYQDRYCYIDDKKYVFSLLKKYGYIIDDCKILIPLRDKNEYDLEKIFLAIDFENKFDETEHYTEQFVDHLTDQMYSQILDDIFKNICQLQFEKQQINHTSEQQQYNASVQASNLYSLIQQSAIPLCMSRILLKLKDKHHLLHQERMQLYPWMQDINIKYEDAVQFIQQQFCKDPGMNQDKFKKEYQYGIRHIYGLEGKKQKTHTLGCQKIQQLPTAPGLTHGCPYKNMGRKDLEDLLNQNNVQDTDVKLQIFNYREKEKYQLACSTVFYWRFNDGLQQFNPIKYFFEAYKKLYDQTQNQNQPQNDQPKEEENKENNTQNQ